MFGATGSALVCGAGLGLAVAFFGGGGPFDTRGELVDSFSSPDGRYQVRVFNWQSVLGEDGWNVVVQRRDGLRYVEAYAGCLFRRNLRATASCIPMGSRPPMAPSVRR